jgi:transcriptional regulator with XRE-family HTH domain
MTDTAPQSPAEAMKAYRKAHGLSRAELAERLEVSRMTIWRYEETDRKIDDDVLPRLVSLTGIEAAVWRPELVALLALPTEAA